MAGPLIYCGDCGADVDPGDRWCHQCSAPLSSTTVFTFSPTEDEQKQIDAAGVRALKRWWATTGVAILIAIGLFLIAGAFFGFSFLFIAIFWMAVLRFRGYGGIRL